MTDSNPDIRATKAQGKKWHFQKDGSSVFTVYHHNKAVILTTKKTNPGSITSIKECGKNDSKILVSIIII